MNNYLDGTPDDKNSLVPSTSYRYPAIAFCLSGIGWVCMIIAVVLQSTAGLIWGYVSLTLLSLAAIVSLVGFFKTQNKKFRWLCTLGAFFAVSPFLFYFFLVHIVLPFVLSGITGPN